MVHVDFSNRGIQCLDLTNSPMTTSNEQEQSVKALTYLTSLDLGHNELVSIKPSLATFVNLKFLDLSHNKLKNCPHLPPLLEKLNLEHNLLSRLPILSRTPHLQYLNLNWNQLMHIPPHLNDLNSLVQLEMAHNHIKNIATSKHSLPSNISVLDISYNEITKARELDVLCNLTNLTNLKCDSNPFLKRDEDEDLNDTLDPLYRIAHICTKLKVLNDIQDERELQQIRDELSLANPAKGNPTSLEALPSKYDDFDDVPSTVSHESQFRDLDTRFSAPVSNVVVQNRQRRMSLNEEQIRHLKKEYLPDGKPLNIKRSSTPQPTRPLNDGVRSLNSSHTSISDVNLSDEKYSQIISKHVKLQKNYKNLQTLFQAEKNRRLELEEEVSKSVQQIAKFRVAMKRMKDEMSELQRRETTTARDIKVLLNYVSVLEFQLPDSSSKMRLHSQPNQKSMPDKQEVKNILTRNLLSTQLSKQISIEDEQKRYKKNTSSYVQKLRKEDEEEKQTNANFNNLQHLAGPMANGASYKWESSLRTAKRSRPTTVSLKQAPAHYSEMNSRESTDCTEISQNEYESISDFSSIRTRTEDECPDQNQSISDILLRIQQDSIDLTRRLSRTLERNEIDDTPLVRVPEPSINLEDSLKSASSIPFDDADISIHDKSTNGSRRDNFSTGETDRSRESVKQMFKQRLEQERRKYGLV